MRYNDAELVSQTLAGNQDAFGELRLVYGLTAKGFAVLSLIAGLANRFREHASLISTLCL